MAIPTTAGTGSEATHFAVVCGRQYSVAHPSLLPEFAVVDPKLTESLPRSVTAATGLDAFCQAIESIWAVNATEVNSICQRGSDSPIKILRRRRAIRLTKARQAMSRASHLAGKAINITKTTAAPRTRMHDIQL